MFLDVFEFFVFLDVLDFFDVFDFLGARCHAQICLADARIYTRSGYVTHHHIKRRIGSRGSVSEVVQGAPGNGSVHENQIESEILP